MKAVIYSFGMESIIISHSCECIKFCPLAVPTVIGPIIGLLLSLGDLGRRCVHVSPLSYTPASLSRFYFFCGGGRWV